jgi:hypothetical protein
MALTTSMIQLVPDLVPDFAENFSRLEHDTESSRLWAFSFPRSRLHIEEPFLDIEAEGD